MNIGAAVTAANTGEGRNGVSVAVTVTGQIKKHVRDNRMKKPYGITM